MKKFVAGIPIVLQLDVKDYFPNWDKMTPEEQASWKRKFAAFKTKERRKLERINKRCNVWTLKSNSRNR